MINSALEIDTKLCDLEFTRKAKAADFYSRTFDLFLVAGAGEGEDEVLVFHTQPFSWLNNAR